jgi:uncharacterized membrane protein YqjE
MATRNVDYINTHRTVGDRDRSIAEVLNDFKTEFKDFLNTRLQMLRAEMSEKAAAYKIAAPAIAIGGVFMVVGFLVLTGALVSGIAWGFSGQPWAYFVAFCIVTVLYLLVGGVALGYGVRSIKSAGIAPERTMKVLKDDQVWLKTEARTQV